MLASVTNMRMKSHINVSCIIFLYVFEGFTVKEVETNSSDGIFFSKGIVFSIF